MVVERARILDSDGRLWRCAETRLKTPDRDEIVVDIEALLIPSPHWEAAFWIGSSSGDPFHRYGGWGPLMDHLVCKREALVSLPPEIPPQEALLPLPARAIATVLEPLLPVHQASVLGRGILSGFVEAYLVARGVSVRPPDAPHNVDLLIDTSGKTSLWAEALSALTGGGTFLLFIPPWGERGDINFYPDIHRKSLTVLSFYWCDCQPHLPIGLKEFQWLQTDARRYQDWIQPLRLGAASVGEDMWQFYRWE